MSIKGQPTRLAGRVETGERWQAGQSDAHIAQALQRPLATVRKWRRRYQRQGRAGFTRPLGRPSMGALEQSSVEVVQAITEMRQAHPGWGRLTLLRELQQAPRFADERLPFPLVPIARNAKRSCWTCNASTPIWPRDAGSVSPIRCSAYQLALPSRLRLAENFACVIS
jgi:transposase-like protein